MSESSLGAKKHIFVKHLTYRMSLVEVAGEPYLTSLAAFVLVPAHNR